MKRQCSTIKAIGYIAATVFAAFALYAGLILAAVFMGA